MALGAKLLLLLAVLLMPFGMSAATAAPPGQAAASMPMSHCPEQGPTQSGKAGFVHCAMACSAALPADQTKRDEPAPIARVAIALDVAARLEGLGSEIATPPPRPS
jgi:hypothetical protein